MIFILTMLSLVTPDTSGMTVQVNCEYMQSYKLEKVYRVSEDGSMIYVVDKFGKQTVFVKANVISIQEIKNGN